MSLLISDLLQLFALAWEEKDFLTLHFALLSDHLSLYVNGQALDSTFHGICLLSISFILNLFSLLDHMLIAPATLVNGWLKLAFFLELFLLSISLVSNPIVDLVSPDLIPLEKGGTLPVLVRKIVVSSRRHHWLKGALLHLFDLVCKFGLEDLGLFCLVPSQCSLIEVLCHRKGPS